MRFSPDGATLFYAMQPDWIPPIWTVVNGRYANLYSVPATGGEPALLFDCNDWQLNLCVGDVAPNGSLLTVTDPGADTVDILSPDGEIAASLAAPETGYLGPALFSPAGDLAFTSAKVVESEGFPLPRPGVLSVARAPYAGDVQTMYSSDEVTTLVRWIDPTHAVVFTVSSPEQNGMAIVTTGGEVQPIQVALPSLASFVAVLP